MKPELLDNALSLWLSNSHVSPLFFSLSFVFYVIFSTLPQACKEAIGPVCASGGGKMHLQTAIFIASIKISRNHSFSRETVVAFAPVVNS